ncbi:hypothetical protein HDU88_001917 [Geranomyces variabilis]|nr:hypothetical protein HDU88_001917 [Geranomyces variabilis]
MGPQPHETEFYVVARMPKDLAVHRAIGVIPVWDSLRRYAGGSMWKDAFLTAIDGAEESVNDARRAKAVLQADSAGFEDMARAIMDAAAASGPSPGFLRGLCGDLAAILQADPLRKTLLLDGHFLAFLPAVLAARLVAKCCSAEALRAMERAYYTAVLDVSGLPTVSRRDDKPAIYLHAGRPRSFDGPNPLPYNTDLVYVGSGQGPRGIFARVFMNHLKASVRRNGPCMHYTSFYGAANGAPAGWAPSGPAPDQSDFFVVARVPIELAKRYEFGVYVETVAAAFHGSFKEAPADWSPSTPAPDGRDYSILARIPAQFAGHRGIGLYVETAAAVAFGALLGHDGYVEARANAGLDPHQAVPWLGTNRLVPIASLDSSREGGHRLPLMYVTKTGGRPDNPAHQLQAFLRHAMGQCAIGVATGAWNAHPSLPVSHAREPKVRVELGKMVLRLRAAAGKRQYELQVSFRRASGSEVHLATLDRLSEPAPGSVLTRAAYRQLQTHAAKWRQEMGDGEEDEEGVEEEDEEEDGEVDGEGESF